MQQKARHETAGSSLMDQRAELSSVKAERDKLQADFNEVMKLPLFKKENNNSEKRLAELQGALQAEEKKCNELQQKLQKTDDLHKNYVREIRTINDQKNQMEKELQNLIRHTDSGLMTVDDVIAKLRNTDPTKFRQAMDDLDF